MDKKQAIELCHYYNGESENPFTYGTNKYPENLINELKYHFWDYERIFVEKHSKNSTIEDFKTFINGCINKCTPSEFDPYIAYFDGVLKKKSEV
jgi:hypothetical protein